VSPSTLLRRPRAERPPPAHPKVAARRRAVRAHASRRKRVALIVLAILSVFASVSWPLLHSRFFSARVLTVVGSRHASTAAVLAAAGLAGHPPMMDGRAGAAARAVEALPWVKTAAVALHWPDGAAVTVRERRAVAVVAAGSRWAELDPTGRVLAIVAAPPAGLARLVSVGPPGAPGTTLAHAEGPLEVAASLPVALASLVTAVSPSKGGGVDLALSDGVGVVLGAPTQLPAKFEDVASILVGARLAAGSVIDVTVPQSPAVAPPGPETPAAGGSRG
jgi:cell division protein FtsQ